MTNPDSPYLDTWIFRHEENPSMSIINKRSLMFKERLVPSCPVLSGIFFLPLLENATGCLISSYHIYPGI